MPLGYLLGKAVNKVANKAVDKTVDKVVENKTGILNALGNGVKILKDLGEEAEAKGYGNVEQYVNEYKKEYKDKKLSVKDLIDELNRQDGPRKVAIRKLLKELGYELDGTVWRKQ